MSLGADRFIHDGRTKYFKVRVVAHIVINDKETRDGYFSLVT